MGKKLYEVVCWPQSQMLQEIDGFDCNAYLISDGIGMSEYGPQAYFVDRDWLKYAKREIRMNRMEYDYNYD